MGIVYVTNPFAYTRFSEGVFFISHKKNKEMAIKDNI